MRLNYRDDSDRVLVTEEELNKAVAEIAYKIEEEYKNSDKKLLLVGILKGSLVFMSDLMKKINLPLEIDFMKVSSYGSGTVSSNEIKLSLDISKKNLEDYNVLIIEDILDTGRTLSWVIKHFENKCAHSVKICTLLDKPDRRVADVTPDFTGFVIPDEFVIGYGLDYDEEYRNLPFIGVLKRSVYEK